MADSKKHHYVPQAVLRNFASDQKATKVWVYNKSARKAYESAILDAGSENHFNTIDVGGVAINLESQFQDADSRLADLIRKLVQTHSLASLDERERHDLAYLAAVQMLRVRLIRDTMSSFPKLLRETLGEAGVDESIAPDIDENTAKIVSLQMLADAEQHMQHLLEKDWWLFEAPKSRPFWTSDNPVVTFNALGYGDTGLASDGVQVLWPISAELLLTFSCRTIANKFDAIRPSSGTKFRSDPLLPCEPNNVDFFNARQVLDSGRFLYSRTRNFGLADRIVSDHPHVGHVQSKVSLGNAGPAPPSAQLTGRWLVVFGTRTSYRCALTTVSESGGEVRVTVAEEGLQELAQAMEDTPHKEARISVDGVNRHGIRGGVLLERDSQNPHVVTVAHADPGLRNLMRRTNRG